MVSNEELKQSEMSYPLKINKLMRGAFIVPCPDCQTPHPEEAKDCDDWCLKNCVFSINREILSDRQKGLHNERRTTSLQQAICMLAKLKEDLEITDEEYRQRVSEVIDHLGK